MKNPIRMLAAASFALLLLAACGTSGIGDVLGGSSNTNLDLRGTVDSVDINGRSIYLTNVSGYNSMLSSGGSSNSVRVFYDQNTTLQYQGRSYRPEDLERGDQISVKATDNNGRLVADSMTVVYDARGGGSAYPAGSGTYGSTLRGTVTYVDTSRGTVQIDTGYGATTIVETNANTPVYYSGKTYRVADIEKGDQIEIRGRDLGSGRYNADDITVTRSVSGGNAGGVQGSQQNSTVRGTVQYVDTASRTIQLSSTTWVAGFNRGTTGGGMLTIHYDPNISVDVQGQLYPVGGLERGDVVDVQLQDLGTSNYLAQRIVLVRDVNAR